jgi:hypothetical protein
MLTTFLLGKNFNVLIGLYIMNPDGIQKLGMVLTMGWVRCDPLGIETLALKDR